MATNMHQSHQRSEVSRQSSIVPDPPASAFGDDDEDYRRVTKQQNDVSKNKEKGAKENGTKFGTATFSRAPKGLDEMQNAISEIERKSSVIEDNHAQVEDSRDSSEHSADQSSDDTGHVTEATGDWQKFASTKFQYRTSHSFSCSALQQPLLSKSDRADHLASLASWVTILRIMGDLPEGDYGDNFAVIGGNKPMIKRVRDNYHRRLTKKDVDDAHKKYTDLVQYRKYSAHSWTTVASEIRNVPFLPDNRESILEKVQYVTTIGIYKSDMRDELYCQVCKQLTNNPSRNSTLRGWVLLAVFAGSFTPTEKFVTSFQHFLRDGPTEHAQRVERLLRRTSIVGTRGQPPSWLEFQAAKNSKPILLPVIMMNGQRQLVEQDAASTVSELCSQLCQTIGLTDSSGFSIYITLGNRIACLGHGLHRVMDAIAESEQHTKELGMRESSSTWRLYFRKEFFTPWYEPGDDSKSTELTYQQIMRGVSMGEYPCEKESVLIMMAAQRYYIEHSANIDTAKIETFLNTWLPKENMESKDMSYWVDKVKSELENDFKSAPHKPSLKADIVTFAMNKWYNLFSRFYDATKVQGPNMQWESVIIGINCKGFSIMDESENVKLRLSFVEITGVSRGKRTATVSTVQGDDYTVTTVHSDDLFSLVTSFQVGLRRRSQYAIAVQDASHFEGAIGFGLSKGDLIKLDKPYEEYGDSDVYTGTSLRNDKHGGLPRDVLYILPTIDAPEANIMGMLQVQFRKEVPLLATSQSDHTIPQGTDGHTLVNYAKIYFRQASENTVSKLLSKASFKKKEKEVAWKFTREPMKKPLLRRTNLREELRRAACRSFTAIQRFMGDAPSKEDVADAEMANARVIDPAIRSKYMRDEIFCQLTKQLTNNPDRSSEERGWQLFWLLATCTYPPSDLIDDADLFLKSHPNRTAKRCLARMHKTKSEGCRIYPPHYLEHEALASRHPSIEYSVMLPDQSKQKLEVDSSTRMSDIHSTIARRLSLREPTEYGLFFGLKDKVISASCSDYFFDNLTHVQRFYIKQSRASIGSEGAGQMPVPVLIFMKKLWINATPGLDKLVDIKFHFPQELPNYLRGYHKCSVDDAIRLASLVFHAKYETKQLEKLEDVLPSLLPLPVLELNSPGDWKKLLVPAIEKVKVATKEDAKVSFLKALHKWKTYGSVFFEVKQRSSKTYPKHVLVAISPQGVALVDAHTKDVLVVYPYDKVPNWAFDDRSFTLVIGEAAGISKIYMETNVGHNLDDIIMTYVAYIMNTHIAKKPSYAGIVVGESVC